MFFLGRTKSRTEQSTVVCTSKSMPRMVLRHACRSYHKIPKPAKSCARLAATNPTNALQYHQTPPNRARAWRSPIPARLKHRHNTRALGGDQSHNATPIPQNTQARQIVRALGGGHTRFCAPRPPPCFQNAIKLDTLSDNRNATPAPHRRLKTPPRIHAHAQHRPRHGR